MRTDGRGYYKVVVAVKTETASGKYKKYNEEYLTLAVSVTDAETRVVENFVKAQDIRDYSIKSASITRILEVV